jgi:mannose-1-phosphate guanylyltransferase
MQGGVAGIELPGIEVRPGVHVGLNTAVAWDSVRFEGPVHIGSGSRIEPGCTFEGPVWVGNGCHIESGSHIERSVVFDYAHVGANATAREVIVSGSYCVSREGQAEDAPAARWWGDARRRGHGPRAAA